MYLTLSRRKSSNLLIINNITKIFIEAIIELLTLSIYIIYLSIFEFISSIISNVSLIKLSDISLTIV